MPREKGRKGQNNKSTKQTQRVSSRPNKGVHSSRGRPQANIPPPSDHSSSDSESDIEADPQTTQHQTSAEQIQLNISTVPSKFDYITVLDLYYTNATVRSYQHCFSST